MKYSKQWELVIKPEVKKAGEILRAAWKILCQMAKSYRRAVSQQETILFLGMLLNIIQCTGQTSKTKKNLAHNVSYTVLRRRNSDVKYYISFTFNQAILISST